MYPGALNPGLKVLGALALGSAPRAGQEKNLSAKERLILREYEEALRPVAGERTIVRVDRAEPSKNLLRGFRAFELLIQRHAELNVRPIGLLRSTAGQP